MPTPTPQVDSIEDWLTSIGLEQYVDLLVRNEVDLSTLRILTDDDLKELGLPFGPRKRLLAALQADKSLGTAEATATQEGERRQLTVLFCDIIGFTELAQRVDPEVLQTIVRLYEDACAACIVHYDGYLYQRTGDGIIAFFGYPMAHESEASRAIRSPHARPTNARRPPISLDCSRSASTSTVGSAHA